MTRRLLYVVSEDWYFLSHRLPMARAARDAGFEVHVATRVQRGADAIRAEGFTLHPVPFERGKLSVTAGLRTMRALRALHHAIEPVLAHHVSLPLTVLASLAALDRDVPSVNALTGFGYAFSSSSPRARMIRPVIGALLRFVVNRGHSVALVQNPDDRDMLRALGIDDHRIACIGGSGVDIARFAPVPEPPGEVAVGFVGRLLEDKGVHTLVDAGRILRRRGVPVTVRIAGDVDPANPTSIDPARVASWRTEPALELLGHITDIPGFWRTTHVAVLPSRREGLPKSLIEAAACGRPMIATDVPGCREIVRAGETGLLVPVDDPDALAGAIEQLVRSPDLRARYGAAARALVEARFASARVAAEIVALYESVLAAREPVVS